MTKYKYICIKKYGLKLKMTLKVCFLTQTKHLMFNMSRSPFGIFDQQQVHNIYYITGLSLANQCSWVQLDPQPATNNLTFKSVK